MKRTLASKMPRTVAQLRRPHSGALEDPAGPVGRSVDTVGPRALVVRPRVSAAPPSALYQFSVAAAGRPSTTSA